MNFVGEKIAIIGAKKSGIAAAKLAQSISAIPFVSELASKEKMVEAYTDLYNSQINCEFGGHSIAISDCKFVIISPGVPKDAAVFGFINPNAILLSEIEFAASFCSATIFAITGTNGKTTTTTLLDYIFAVAGKKSFAAGNIGLPFSQIAEELNENDAVALEVSSFQLDIIRDFKPKIAMILNITPDHLNRYDNSFEKYALAKHNITKNQTSDDLLILNFDDKGLNQFEIKTAARKSYFSLNSKVSNGAYLSDGNILYVEDNVILFSIDKSSLSIQGEHNAANAMACIIAAKAFGIENEYLTKALSTFTGVEHRLERVESNDGIIYINDSKATNVDSVWYALRSFETPLYLILGGTDKGNDYSSIKELVVERVKQIFAIGSSSEKVYDYFKDVTKVTKVADFKDCVMHVHNKAERGDILLLSPACASFDMFDNYEHRGQVFKSTVKEIAG